MAKIVPVEELQPAFKNAMAHLHHECARRHPNEAITIGSTINYFKEEFDCYLFHGNNFDWESVGFKNDEQQLMFMLKWS
jgi:hypothetical protein